MRKKYYIGLPATILASASVMSLQASSLHASANYFDMSIEELLQLEVNSIASMSPTTSQQDPAAVTTISRDDIENSGARDLLELLEIFVPNTQFVPHHWEPLHLGARGIISHRDDKYLLKVNGKVMNNQMHSGALSERNLPVLGDIARVDVIRGPGSVVHGPGAVSMVINITTLNAKQAEGTMVALQAAGGNKFLAAEARHGTQWSDTHNLLVYAGIVSQEGADNDSAPVVYGDTNTTGWGDQTVAGEKSTFDHPNDGANYLGKPKVKLHAEYQFENANIWARYTKSGETLVWSPWAITTPPSGGATPGTPQSDYYQQQAGHQQFTIMGSYKHIFSETLYGNISASYDFFDNERRLFDFKPAGSIDENEDVREMDEGLENSREEEYLVQGRLNWQPHKKHLLSFGLDYAYEQWGKKSELSSSQQAVSFVLGDIDETWTTQRYALLSEHQWHINNIWTNYIGFRLDKDTYTDYMFSPRLATVISPNSRDTYKLILSRSSRKNFAEELRDQYLSDVNGDPEVLDSFEFLYQAVFDQWKVGTTFFANRLDLISWNAGSKQADNVGVQKSAGVELELEYHTKALQVNFSHSYTKLINFDLYDENTSQTITSKPYGYGDDLNNWSNHITKLYMLGHMTQAWTASTSLRIFWEYQGSKDFSEYKSYNEEGYDEPFGMSLFWNANTAYRFNQYIKAQLDAYNILGMIDHKYNKRAYLNNVANYRADAPTVRVKLTADF